MKTILISGASGSIGTAIAKVYMEEKDTKVILLANTQYDKVKKIAMDEQEKGKSVFAYQCDFTSRSDIDLNCRRILAEIGHVDILINNAGYAPKQQLACELSLEDWDRTFAVNVDSAFLLIRAFVPGMVKTGKGSIVNISSIWGVTGGSCEAAYSASKAALIGLTKALAKELGPSGIRINCVAPGMICSNMNAHLSQADIECFNEETALGRTGLPEEIAKAVVFAAGDESSFMTGQTINVDGGYCI